MSYVVVLLLAAAAGAAVGVATLRTGREPQARQEAWTQTYEPPAVAAEGVQRSSATETAGRTPLPGDPTTRSRVVGVLGLVVVCLAAAAAIVGGLFAAYVTVRGMFGR